jgi:hypothetical protein
MRRLLAMGLLLAALGAGAASCFSPMKPACTFACGPGGACPDEYLCASDNLCHRADGQGQCDLSPSDAGAD